MARQFSDEDREKPIVTSEGRTIGTVRDVDRDRDRATVDRSDDHDSLTDEIKDMLGWDDDEHELRGEHIDRSEDNHLYLRPRR